MKQRKMVLPVLLTILLLGLGVCLPRLTSVFADYRLKQGITQKGTPQVTIALSDHTDFFHSLELFDTKQSQIQLTEGYHLTTAEVKNTAAEIVGELTAANMEQEKPVVVYPDATPVLIANKDNPTLSGVFWRCVWSDGSKQQNVLWLDDQSGKLVALQWQLPVTTSLVTLESEDRLQKAAAVMAEFLRSHYPVEDVALAAKNSNEYTLVLAKKNAGEINTYSIPLRFSGGMLYFNL